VVSDQTSAPTYAPDLAIMLDGLMEAGARGTLHAAGANGCTRLEWAQEILRLVGKTDVRLRPVTNAQLHRPAPRPVYSVLSTACLEQFGLRGRPWQQSLIDYLTARQRIARIASLPATG
jgi:dTDP-4-dehydrorhamnose reductase